MTEAGYSMSQKVSLLVLLATLLGVSCTREQPKPPEQGDRVVTDTITMTGKWEVVSSEEEGQPTTAAHKAGTAWVTVIVIEGDELYFTDGFVKSGGSKYKLDTTTDPRSIDLDDGKGEVSKGIYALDKDSLKLCMSPGGERPKEFKTKAGDKAALFVLKRQQP